MNDAAIETDRIVGIWHLVDLEADETNLPAHRVDLAFRRTTTGLAGVVLSRQDGTDLGPLVMQFEGPVLRLQMRVPIAGQEEPGVSPWLVLRQTDDRFQGRWHNSADEAVGPTLKLVRGRGPDEDEQYGV